MVIVAGHLIVDPAQRADYLSGCADVVHEARAADGCLDFALSADLIDAGRVNILERWESLTAVEAFRGSGVGGEQGAAILTASVVEYDVGAARILS
ncbi:putative quinol monooxygenase [Mycolicibacterium tusciae]|uniref:putative quinol monooxygenase n=1 Tax=Mycolicibacterium tusciae TaxID=75922 RepID=UPI00024A1245|nr:antibiotic biosynthesis monooxygenase family protein [Mycolicibacterium tusciae]